MTLFFDRNENIPLRLGNTDCLVVCSQDSLMILVLPRGYDRAVEFRVSFRFLK